MEDDSYIPLSYISQYNYCRRRVGLLMLEQQWNDNSDTVKVQLNIKMFIQLLFLQEITLSPFLT